MSREFALRLALSVAVPPTEPANLRSAQGTVRAARLLPAHYALQPLPLLFLVRPVMYSSRVTCSKLR